MSDKYYIVKENKNKLTFSECANFTDAKNIREINKDLRIDILKKLYKTPMYPSKLAKKMKVNEQNLYYHVNQMIKAGLLEIVERKEIRGTVAKKLKPRNLNFSLTLSEEWSPIEDLIKISKNKNAESFFEAFISKGTFNGCIVVGSPDPHGPYKARSRDGHYAIDLSFFIGNITQISPEFTTKLDVDVKIEELNENVVLVGGPVTNLCVSEVNSSLPVYFSDKKPWGILSKRTNKKYTDDTTGIVVKIPHPFFPEKSIIVLAGISAVGTKAAVLALTRNNTSLLQNYVGQKTYGTIINGFDLDADGKIDSTDIME